MFNKELFNELAEKYTDNQDDNTFDFSEKVKQWDKHPDEFVEWFTGRKLHLYQKIWIRTLYGIKSKNI